VGGKYDAVPLVLEEKAGLIFLISPESFSAAPAEAVGVDESVAGKVFFLPEVVPATVPSDVLRLFGFPEVDFSIPEDSFPAVLALRKTNCQPVGLSY